VESPDDRRGDCIPCPVGDRNRRDRLDRETRDASSAKTVGVCVRGQGVSHKSPILVTW